MKRWIYTSNFKIFFAVQLAVLTISVVASFFYFRSSTPNQTTGKIENSQVVTRDQPLNQQTTQELSSLNVLLLGYGGAGHQGGYLTDIIQLLHLDFDNSRLALISIPRDLWVNLPNGKQAKINQAFTLGDDASQPIMSGAEVSKQMASVVTGLPIDYFVAVDFVGFKRLIGQDLDGIEVDVPEVLDDPWYPITGREVDPCGMTPDEVAEVTAEYSGFELERQFECRYEHLHFEPGLTQMEGGDALKYVRSRHGSSAGDFSRSLRQQAVLEGIKNRLISLEALQNLPDIFETVSQNVTTDLDLEILEYLQPALKSALDFKISSIILSTDNVFQSGRSQDGQSVLLSRGTWTDIHTYIQTELD